MKKAERSSLSTVGKAASSVRHDRDVEWTTSMASHGSPGLKLQQRGCRQRHNNNNGDDLMPMKRKTIKHIQFLSASELKKHK